MCGLAGLVDAAARMAPADRLRAVEAMAARLQHRGPDDAQSWAEPEAGIALGFRRLAIIDLSPAGRQPMASADGRWVVAYNGEIYNHADLRHGLAVDWRGHSDTEALVESIAARGFAATIEALDGMFAIAAWDRAARQLLLARDRFGEKPLYYGRHGGVFAFASELKAFAALDGWAPPLDGEAALQFLRYAYVPAPRTPYQGWMKLPPGQWLTVGADGAVAGPQPFWSAAEGMRAATVNAIDETAAVTALETELRAAVNSRLEADVPLGAFLSGGIDSSTMVAMLRAEGRAVRTFTIAFPGTRYDEAPHAAAVAAALGTEHTEMAVSESQAQDAVTTLPQLFDEPFADASAIPTLLLSLLTRRAVTVALSGDGGDELFAGYQRHLAAPAAWARIGPRSVEWRAVAGVAARAVPHLGRRSAKLRRNLGRSGYRAFPRLFRDHVTQWHDDELEGSPPEDAFDAPDDPILSPFRQGLLLDTVTYLPDDLLCKVDRCAMAASLEVRAPFLARHLARFVWSLPDAMIARGGQSKYLLRQVLYRYLPPALVDRPKQGFEPPVGDWLRGGLRDWAEELIARPDLEAQGLIDAAAVRQCWQEHVSGKRNHTYRLWTVLMWQAWLAAAGRA